MVEIFAFAHTSKLVARELFLLLFKIVPEIEQGEKVARGVDEAGVLLVGLRSLIEGAFAGVLNTEGRDDRHHFARGAVLLRFDHHAGKARVDGQLRELLADAGDSRRGFLRGAIRGAGAVDAR